MYKKYTIKLLITVVLLWFIMNFGPVQDFLFNMRSLLQPNVQQEILNDWKNKSNNFLLWEAKSINSTYSWIALTILVERKEKKAFEVLLKKTKSGNEQNRIWAFLGLAELGDKRAIEPMMKIIKVGRRHRDYLNALDGLSLMHYDAIYLEILKMAEDGYETSSAVTFLERFPEKPETLPALEKIAKSDPEEYIRFKAEDAILRIKTGTKIPVFKE